MGFDFLNEFEAICQGGLKATVVVILGLWIKDVWVKTMKLLHILKPRLVLPSTTCLKNFFYIIQ